MLLDVFVGAGGRAHDQRGPARADNNDVCYHLHGVDDRKSVDHF
ncbi:MAG: hypothetical protein ACXVJ3_19705 [Ilumatobacteraceae bacterium]